MSPIQRFTASFGICTRTSCLASTSQLKIAPSTAGQIRFLSFSEKQKRRYANPPPLHATKEEYEALKPVVEKLRAECAEVTKEITPLQVREADLRKKEYELWQKIRAIKRHLMEETEAKKKQYLRWELARRKQLAEDERAGRRKKHPMQYLCW